MIQRRLKTPVLAGTLLTLAACTAAPPRDCSPEAAWQTGLAGTPVDEVCAANADRLWREANNLSRNLRTLRRQLAGLENDTDTGIFDRVRLEREIQQIEGAAAIRGWPFEIE
ncbi:MAG: hypothetical protein AAGA23_06095 [Pseudomonadota bacterium]